MNEQTVPVTDRCEEFPLLKTNVYLDHAGSTLFSKSQLAAVFEDLSRNSYGNPHSRHTTSKLSSDVIDQVRFKVLDHFHTDADSYEVVFTSGATHSLKIVAENFDFGSDTPGSFVYLKESHTSVVGMRECMLAKNIPVHAVSNSSANKLFNTESVSSVTTLNNNSNSLFAFPAQCNFSGYKFPLSWLDSVKNGALEGVVRNRATILNAETFSENEESSKWFTLLDAASFCATNDLDLSRYQPDFVCISFYKIFGYPTGVGALLVHKRAQHTLSKTYFGGGTVQMYLSSKPFHVQRPVLHERFEDGTCNFLGVISLRHGFEYLQKTMKSMNHISSHTFEIARYTFSQLSDYRYQNGNKLAEVYCETDFSDRTKQGGILSFNLKRPSGEYIGYTEVEKVLAMHDISVRTGCFCNPAACQRYLNLSDEDIKAQYAAGHVCGDENDLIDGRPTGAIRISFGYMSTKEDADRLLNVIEHCFLKREHELLELNWKPLSFTSAEPSLVQINVFPIKSCGAFSVSKWPVTERGLAYDRHWVIVNAAGAVVTQKREPRMCLIKPEINLQQNYLQLNCEGFAPIRISLREKGGAIYSPSFCTTKVCGNVVKGSFCGDDVSEWLGEIFNQKGMKLLQQVEDNEDSVKRSLANDSQFLLINKQSVSHLTAEISRRNPETAITDDVLLSRFRGNLIIDAVGPYEEEGWANFSIGKLKFQAQGVCSRCQMICVDQETGKRSQEPLLTLSQVRGKRIPFGIHVNLERCPDDSLNSTWISVGDVLNPDN